MAFPHKQASEHHLSRLEFPPAGGAASVVPSLLSCIAVRTAKDVDKALLNRAAVALDFKDPGSQPFSGTKAFPAEGAAPLINTCDLAGYPALSIRHSGTQGVPGSWLRYRPATRQQQQARHDSGNEEQHCKLGRCHDDRRQHTLAW